MENNKKTILYLITQSELGGAQRYVFDLAKNFKNEFNVFVAFGEQGKSGELAKKLDKENIKYFIIPYLKRSISLIMDFLALINIINIIKKIKPDIIHLNSSKISIIGSLASLCAKRRALCVYTAHGWVFNEPMSKFKKIFYFYAEKFTAILKDKIICVSKFDKEVAINKKITHEKKLISIHNGIEEITFLNKEKSRERLYILSEKIIIGSIGNLYKTKGFEYLIKATDILKKEYPEIKMIIIGEGKEKRNLHGLIKKYNLENNFILAGRINNASRILKAFDIYVCSSVKEGLSYTIIEAMQAGLPIIATNVGGNPELIKNNISGLIARSRNPNSLAKNIKKLLETKKFREKLGLKAQEISQKEFNLEKMINKTREVYNNE